MEMMKGWSAEGVIQKIIPELAKDEDMIQLLQLIRHFNNLHVKYVALHHLDKLVASVNLRDKEKLHHLLSFEKRLRSQVSKPKTEIISQKFMDDLYTLYTDVLFTLYLGLLHGNIKYSDLSFSQRDLNELVDEINRIQGSLNMKLAANLVINANLEYKIKLLQKLLSDRICAWQDLALKPKRKLWDTKSFNHEKYKNILHKLIAMCQKDPTVGDPKVEGDELIDEIASINSWLERYVFLHYLVTNVITFFKPA